MENESNRRTLFPGFPASGRDVLWIALVVLVYFALARLSLALVFEPVRIAAIWPPAGIFLSAILLARRRLRPWLVGALFLTDFIAEILAGTPVLVSLVYALILTGEAGLSSWLLLRFVGGPIDFRRVRFLIGWLLLSVIFTNALASLAAAGTATIFLKEASFWNSLKWWMASDGIGNLLVTPLVLSWAAWRTNRLKPLKVKRVLEGAALFFLLALVNYLAFSRLSEDDRFSLLLTYLTFPFLLWAAFRFGVRGVTSASALLAAITIYFASSGHITHPLLQSSALDVVFTVQLYIAIMVIPSLFLASVVTEQRQAETARKASEDKFEYFFKYSSIGHSTTLPSGEIQANNAFCEMLGYSTEELQSKKWQEITHPDDIELTQREVNSLISGEKESVKFTKRYLRKDGFIVWTDLTSSLRKDETGRPLYFMTTMVDVTERMRSEEALQKNEAQLRAILDATPFPVALVDVLDNNIEYWSRSALTFFGHTAPTAPEWYLLAYPDAAYRQEVIDRWKPALEKAQKSGQAVNTGEYRVTCQDGSVRICELYAAFQADRLIVTFNDITERKQAEEQASASQRLLQDTIDNSTSLIYALDLEGKFLLINRSLEILFGVPRGVMVGKTRADFLPLETAIAHRANDLQVITDHKSFTFEEVNSEPDGMHTYLTVKFPIVDSHGAVYGIGGISTDITERKLADKALRESQEQFQAIASHTPDHILIQDSQLRYTFVVNPQLGLTIEDMIGKTDYDLAPKADADHLTEIKTRVLNTSKAEYVDVSLTSLSGKIEYFNGTYIPKVDAQGRVDGLIGYFRNVTEHKQAEKQAADQLEELRRWNTATLGREARILDLKREVNRLMAESGQPPRYPSAVESEGQKEEK